MSREHYQFLLKLRTDLHTIPCLLQNISCEYLASHPTINSQNDGDQRFKTITLLCEWSSSCSQDICSNEEEGHKVKALTIWILYHDPAKRLCLPWHSTSLRATLWSSSTVLRRISPASVSVLSSRSLVDSGRFQCESIYILHIHIYCRVYFQRPKLPWWPMILQIYAIAALQ